MENKIQAEIILGSENTFGDKIVTWKLTFPRIVLAEFNTHRMISKNSASSRAIPFETLLKRVKEEPFVPIKWLTEHKGMQGFDYYTNPEDIQQCEDIWLQARDYAVDHAQVLNAHKVSKQFINRLLEPFMWHTVIATGTEWENFFALRAHHMAEIHIQDLAYKMLEEYNKYEFQKLKSDEWHIPFQELIDDSVCLSIVEKEMGGYCTETQALVNIAGNKLRFVKAKVSAGICAGISYGRIKDKIDIADMIDLHDSLVVRPYEGKRGIRSIEDPIHASPTEHQARACRGNELGYSGNFRGFRQYRKMLVNENAKDSRVKQ